MKAELGSFAVSAEHGDVAAFSDAARLDATRLDATRLDAARLDEARPGLGDGSPVELPFTWPIRWLARPEIRAALTALMPEAGLVPFHESQTFDYVAPLQAGVGYTLDVAARRVNGPPEQLVLEATISDAGGTTQATVETVLRLFATGQAA